MGALGGVGRCRQSCTSFRFIFSLSFVENIITKFSRKAYVNMQGTHIRTREYVGFITTSPILNCDDHKIICRRALKPLNLTRICVCANINCCAATNSSHRIKTNETFWRCVTFRNAFYCSYI